jgi:hypothetical protein
MPGLFIKGFLGPKQTGLSMFPLLSPREYGMGIPRWEGDFLILGVLGGEL